MEVNEFDKQMTVKVTDVTTQEVVALSQYLDDHLGESYTILEEGGLELSVDVERRDGELLFEFGMGTGFSGKKSSVNIAIGDLTLEEFETAVKSLQEILDHFKTPT